MKIEITQAAGPIDFNGYEIYTANHRKTKILNLSGSHSNQILSRVFWEEEILDLLGEKQYKRFEAGKFEFDVPKRDIFRVSKDPTYHV